MSLLSVSDYVWVFASIAQTCLFVVAVKRKLDRELPWFCAYNLFQIVRTVALFSVAPFKWFAFYLYWTTEIVDALVSICVVRELYEKTFAGYHSLRGLSQTVFNWSLGVLAVFCLITGYLAPGNPTVRMTASLTVMQRSIAMLIGGLFVALLLLARWTGISWRNRSVGISLGFVVYIAVFATATAVWANGMSRVEYFVFAIINSAGYAVAVGIWIVFAIRQTAEVRVESNESESALLQRWNTSMEAVIQTK